MKQETTERNATGRDKGRGAWERVRRWDGAVWVQGISIMLILLGVATILRALPTAAAVAALADWIQQLGMLGPLLFIVVYVAWTVLLLPGWPLSVAAGMLFGLLGGVLVVWTGAVAGMAASFLVARYAARGLVERRLRRNPKFAAVDRAVGERGWKIVALLRLSPAVPFNVQNYLYGLTAIRFWPCLLTSAVTILPGTIMYVYLGLAGRLGLEAVEGEPRERATIEWVLLAVGLLATIAVTVYVTILASRAVREQTALGDGAGGGSEEDPSAEVRPPGGRPRPERGQG